MVTTFCTKSIHLIYKDHFYEALINMNMTHDEIYDSLRAAVYNVVEPYHIIISNAQSNEKMHLDYNGLRSDRLYSIVLSDGYSHGTNSASNGARKIAHNLSLIMQHWGVIDKSYILPQELMPLEWSRSLTESLSKLSHRSIGHRETAWQWLFAEAALQHSRNEENDRAEPRKKGIQKSDIDNVVRKWDMMLDTMAMARAEAQKIAVTANE